MEENKNNVEVEETENTQEQEQGNTTFTRSDVDREVSKAVEKAITNQRKKWEEEKQAEEDKRLQELEKREKELNNRQLFPEIQSDLQENNLPKDLAELLLPIQDNEKIKTQINTIKELIDNTVNERVKETLRQDE